MRMTMELLLTNWLLECLFMVVALLSAMQIAMDWGLTMLDPHHLVHTHKRLESIPTMR